MTNLTTITKNYLSIQKCKSCGATRNVITKELKRKAIKCYNGCHGSIPTRRTPIGGVDDIATTHPHLIKYFANDEDVYKYKIGVNKKLKMICPNCGGLKEMTPRRLLREGFSCSYCSDGFSYAEKFMANLLAELGVSFKAQFKIGNEGVRYDFYIPSVELIIETHGAQHYERGFGKRTLKEEQENDRYKMDLALSKGYDYIALDCRKSEMEWIRSSIMNSKLSVLFDLSNVNWKDISMKATNSLMIEVINYYNKTGDNTVEIADQFGLCDTTIGRYLSKGEELGLCTYIRQTNTRTIVVIKDNKILTKGKTAEIAKLFGYKDNTLILRIANGNGKIEGKPHFVSSRQYGLLGFYIADSEEWGQDKHLYMEEAE